MGFLFTMDFLELIILIIILWYWLPRWIKTKKEKSEILKKISSLEEKIINLEKENKKLMENITTMFIYPK